MVLTDRQRRLAARAAYAVGAGALVVAGLAVQRRRVWPGADVAGSMLYTALLGCLLGVVWPLARSWVLAGAAVVCSTVIELAQLTSWPADVARRFPPARLVFGSTFAWGDVAAYVQGGLALWAVVATVRMLAGPDPDERADHRT